MLLLRRYLPSHCLLVTANGGVIAVSGSHIITAAAHFFSTPVVFLTGLHKISPISPHNTVGFSYFKSPENVYSFSEGMKSLGTNVFSAPRC